jgi:hypothetical protein
MYSLLFLFLIVNDKEGFLCDSSKDRLIGLRVTPDVSNMQDIVGSTFLVWLEASNFFWLKAPSEFSVIMIDWS